MTPHETPGTRVRGGGGLPERAPRRLLFGGDWNPEQWPREVWDDDVRLMREAGVTTATLGVFSWSVLEPEEGRYDFTLLDDALELLHRHGLDAFLATPTASPPPWFSLAHPDALPVRADGTRLSHGSRDTYCLAAPAYREASLRLATALGERYGHHPALLGWHVHNEYGTQCWCDHAAAAFRTWLRARYGTLEALNSAWGTAFWSQRYGAWEQVLPPRATQYLHNPAHLVDFKRWTSDELLACFTEQRDALRASGSTAPVTTNFMLPTWNHLEQWSWSREQDLVSLDHYLDTTGPDGEAHVAYAGDLARSWAGGRPWLLMEQSAGGITTWAADGSSTTAHKDPSRMLRNSLSYLARGSQGSLFFQWRASTAGAETWHSALVPHAGPDSEGFRAACELGAVLLWHADGWWALESGGLPSTRLDYSDAVRRTHRELHHLGMAVDVVQPGADLGRYRLVLVPSLAGMDDATVTALHRHVEDQGGHLVVFPFTGVADQDLRVVAGGYPGRLRDLLGVRVEQLRPLLPGERVTLDDGSAGGTWSELVHAEGAAVTRRYAGGGLDGLPATTVREVAGGGRAHYVSTRLARADLRRLLAALADDAGVRPVVADLPEDVEAVRRRGARGSYLVVLNHGSAPVAVSGPGVDLVGGQGLEQPVVLPAGGFLVARESAGAAAAGGWRAARTGPGSAPLTTASGRSGP